MTGGKRWPAVPLLAALAVVSALAAAGSFFAATTFIGDDHLFLTFARLVPNPLVAFVSDQHGGEYYRPLPMTLWWLLARASGGAPWPFQLTAVVLHALVAVEVAALARLAGEPRSLSALAGLLFFLAPQNLEAAYWFSASTDLLASAALLGSLILLARPTLGAGAWIASLLLAAAAYLSKESALVLPLLAFVAIGRRRGVTGGWYRPLPHALLAVGFLAVRWRVLHGWGGTSDPAATLPGKLAQIAAGLVHVGTGTATVPAPLAWGLGSVALFFIGRQMVRDARSAVPPSAPAAWQPAAFTAIALLPVLGASWATSARYFYLPAVGLAWLGARALAAAAAPARPLVAGGLLLVAALQAGLRHAEIADYDARLAAVRLAVADGLRRGQAIFHVTAGIKDLDLAVKESPAVAATGGPDRPFIVLADVPASFVLLPSELAGDADVLLARPPIPPTGAYHFGGARVVGLARRGDDPDLDAVVRRFPSIHFLRLARAPDGTIAVRDATDAVRKNLAAP